MAHKAMHMLTTCAIRVWPMSWPKKATCCQKAAISTAPSMCSATLGAGCLSLPYAIKLAGIGPGLLLLLLTALATHFSVVLLVGAIATTGSSSYEELTVHLFGKGVGLVVEVCIILFCFGTTIAYTVAVVDIIGPVIALPAVHGLLPWLTAERLVVLVWSCVMLPLSLADSMASLQVP